MTVLAKGHFFLRNFGGWDPQGEPRSHFFFMKFPNAIHGCLVYLRYKKTAIFMVNVDKDTSPIEWT